jgi:hypothetical protein
MYAIPRGHNNSVSEVPVLPPQANQELPRTQIPSVLHSFSHDKHVPAFSFPGMVVTKPTHHWDSCVCSIVHCLQFLLVQQNLWTNVFAARPIWCSYSIYSCCDADIHPRRMIHPRPAKRAAGSELWNWWTIVAQTQLRRGYKVQDWPWDLRVEIQTVWKTKHTMKTSGRFIDFLRFWWVLLSRCQLIWAVWRIFWISRMQIQLFTARNLFEIDIMRRSKSFFDSNSIALSPRLSRLCLSCTLFALSRTRYPPIPISITLPLYLPLTPLARWGSHSLRTSLTHPSYRSSWAQSCVF